MHNARVRLYDLGAGICKVYKSSTLSLTCSLSQKVEPVASRRLPKSFLLWPFFPRRTPVFGGAPPLSLLCPAIPAVPAIAAVNPYPSRQLLLQLSFSSRATSPAGVKLAQYGCPYLLAPRHPESLAWGVNCESSMPFHTPMLSPRLMN